MSNVSVNMESGRNIIIENAEFHWVKLDPRKPVSPFGTAIWELTIHLAKKDAKGMLFDELGIKPKEQDGKFVFNLKRKAEKTSGDKNTPVVVLDKDGQPLDPNTIGNGSKGKVKVFQYDWAVNTRKGTSNVLMAVKVETLVEFKRGGGVDIFGDAAKGKPVAETDDDLF